MKRPPYEIDLEALRALPDHERQEAISRLAQFKRLVESNPLWSYVPHEGEKEFKVEHGISLHGHESRGQVEFHEIDRKVGAFVAGNRSGKSHAGVADDL